MSTRQPLTLPPHVNPAQSPTATAPYNFVPLPELVVPAVESAEALPDHDHYERARHTGYFDITLLTRSPLYVRCPLTTDQLLRQDRGDDAKLPFREQVKNTPDFFYTRDPDQPVIPGSSLRGMLRGLLEIISYGKVQWVTERQLVYRAVGDRSSLGQHYRTQLLGANKGSSPNMHFDYPSSKVRGGYLRRTRAGWAIQPAKEILSETFVHVEYTAAQPIIGTYGRQQVHPVFVEPAGRVSSPRGSRGSANLVLDLAITKRVTASPSSGLVPAKLVESGHMEGAHAKHWHCAIYEPDPNTALIPIPDSVWETYQEDRDLTRGPLTPTRKLMHDGDPLFCLLDGKGQLVFFGPTMMLRLPYTQLAIDLVPPALRRPEEIDYAEALFGFVRTDRELKNLEQRGLPVPKQGSKGRAYAGRVCVTNAVLVGGQSDIWPALEPLVPKILATPKPTAFQHYLVQTSDRKNSLRHYDSASPDETVIRGHKLYWRQRADWVSSDDATRMIEEDPQKRADIDRQEGMGKPDTQHTQLKPVKAGIRFTFRVYFENLSDEELGALSWALHPLGHPGKDYCHSLGMGKPLGMGAVKLQATLCLTDRTRRYTHLFDGDRWQTGIAETGERLSDAEGLERPVPTDPQRIARVGEELADRATLERLVEPFEKRILETLRLYPTHNHLFELRRIEILLRMLEWPGLDPQGTRYMEAGQFRDRLVLPDPSDPEVFGPLTGQAQPEPDTLNRAGKAVATHPTLLAKRTPGLAIKVPSPEARLPTVIIKKELVTLVEDAKRGKARVQTTQGELILCNQFPPHPPAEVGMRCRAKVTRQNGQAQQATFNRWE